MDAFSALDIGASALSAERAHMNVISMNLANAKTTRVAGGKGPYQRKTVNYRAANLDDSPFAKAMNASLDAEKDLKGVKVSSVVNDNRPVKRVFEPGHPDADQEGYVSYPDINVVEEMTNLITVSRSFEANVTSISTAKAMYQKALEIGR